MPPSLRTKANDDFYKCITGDELLTEDKPPEYLIKGLLPKGSVCLLLATSNVGKTMLACAAMVSTASGRPLLGHYPVNQGRALLLDWESRAGFIKDRVRQLSRGLNLDPGFRHNLSIKTPVPFHSTDHEFLDHMKRFCDGKDLVVLDSLAAMSPGVDENDRNIRVALDKLRYVNTYTTFLIIHHTRKLQLGYEPKEDEELGRGSGAIKQAVDVEYTFIRQPNGYIKTYQTKNRLGQRMQKPFIWSMSSDWNGEFSNWIKLDYLGPW